MRRLRDFKYLVLQRGPRDNTAKVFLVTPGNTEELLGLIDPPQPAELMEFALQHADISPVDSLDQIATERLSIVANHLFQAKATHGAFLPIDSINERSIAKAFRDVQKQQPDEADDQAEGVMKELQAL